MTIGRYITDADIELYQRCGWRLAFLFHRGDGLACFIATFVCCGR